MIALAHYEKEEIANTLNSRACVPEKAFPIVVSECKGDNQSQQLFRSFLEVENYLLKCLQRIKRLQSLTLSSYST